MPGYGRNNNRMGSRGRGSTGRRGARQTNRNARLTRGNGRAGRASTGRTHSHSYDPDIQRHWSTYPGGTTNAPSGYTHTHDGRSHSHPFSDRTQEHWGRYSGGRGQGTQGYSHTHAQGGGQPTPRGRTGRRQIRRTTRGRMGRGY